MVFALGVLSVQRAGVTAQGGDGAECPAHSSGAGGGARCVCEAGYEGVVAYSSLRGDYVSSCEEASASGGGAAGGAGGGAGGAVRMTSVHQLALPVEQDCYPSCATASQQYARTHPPANHSLSSAFARARTHCCTRLCPLVRRPVAHADKRCSLSAGFCTGRSRCSSRRYLHSHWDRLCGSVADARFGRCSLAPQC